MRSRYLLILLASVMPACNDAGLVPPETERVSRPIDAVYPIGVIPGVYTALRCVDSLGTPRVKFDSSEQVFLRYTVINQTGKEQTWARGMSTPWAQFFAMRGGDTLADSFAGLAFAAVPSEGTLRDGDSLTAAWVIDPAKIHLSAGAYLATAYPRFALLGLGVPGYSWKVFDINQ